MIRNLVCGHHLCFSLVACEDDDLSRICLLQPLQRGVQPVFVVQHEAVIKDQRHVIAFRLDELGGGEAEGQVDLVHGAAGYLLHRDQAGAGS